MLMIIMVMMVMVTMMVMVSARGHLVLQTKADRIPAHTDRPQHGSHGVKDTAVATTRTPPARHEGGARRRAHLNVTP